MILFRYKISLFVILLSIQQAFADSATRGLHFYSYEVNKENRTSLHIPLSDIHSIHDGFSMSFDLKIRNEKQNFGYIFRLTDNSNANMDLVISDLRAKEEKRISLIANDKVIIQFTKNEIPDFKFDAWNKFKISFFKNFISITLNDTTKTYSGKVRPTHISDMFFGSNNHPFVFTTETPPMIIKNIRLFNRKNKEVRYWRLDKHGKDFVCDEHEKDKAFVSNPKWELDAKTVWKKQKTLLFAPYPQIAYDNCSGRIFFMSGDRMIIYNIQSNTLDTVKNIQGTPFKYQSNHTVYNSNSKNIISYYLSDNMVDNKWTEFDFQSNKWNNSDNVYQEPFYWHHGKVYIPEDSLLITVGGYGFHKYKGTLIKYSFTNKKWEKINLSPTMSPRYLGSLGYLGTGKLLYFGGYGSESGNQEEHPQNYYDLYLIDIHTDSVTQLWNIELPSNEEHYTNSNSMIIDEENDSFYILTYSNNLYKTHIQARKFKISVPESSLVGDTIPYLFNDIKSYCDLFLYTNTLAAITTYTEDDNTNSEINIYTINYRPLNKLDVLQTEKQPTHYWYFLPLLLLLPIVFFIWKRMTGKGKVKHSANSQVEVSLDKPNYETLPTEIRPSSISLLGDFNVIDDLGVDVTGHFTSVTSQIFLLSLLSSIKNGKGISSQELKNILWYDKDNDSARNNRNVNVSKLRLILKNLKGFEILNVNSYWAVTLNKEVFCDYKNTLSLIKIIEKDTISGKDRLNELLNLASKGVLLPNMQLEWLDDYKSEYSNLIIDKLFQITEREDVKNDLVLLVKIANVILLHDNIDEDAIIKKCYALYHLGKKGKAKQCFEKFTEDYRNLLGTEYKYTFNQFREAYL
jgi:DNA-binding SARP family transcriptional activator